MGICSSSGCNVPTPEPSVEIADVETPKRTAETKTVKEELPQQWSVAQLLLHGTTAPLEVKDKFGLPPSSISFSLFLLWMLDHSKFFQGKL